MVVIMSPNASHRQFRVGLSRDFLNEQGTLVFPDIGLSLLDGAAGLSHEFLAEYRAEYVPEQLRDLDVIISLKPRVSADSLKGVERLAAVGRCGVGYDNVDLAACTENDIAVFITPTAVMRPVAESIVLFVLALSHNLVLKDRLIRQGRWVESTRQLGAEPRDRVVGTIGLGNIAGESPAPPLRYRAVSSVRSVRSGGQGPAARGGDYQPGYSAGRVRLPPHQLRAHC
jgi:hypothetical protein